MKKLYFLLAAFIMACQLIHAQQLLRTYYDYKKTKVHEEYYANSYGVKNGSYKEFSEFGGILRQGTYKSDVMVGSWVSKNQDGSPSMIENFNDKGERSGVFKSWLNGHLIIEENYLNGKKNGICKEWDATVDVLVKDQIYKDGTRNGKSILYYYETGKKKVEGNYENDMGQGVFTFYYKDGAIESEGALVNGEKNGSWKFYNKTGKLFKQGTLKNEKEEGEWIYYDDSGNGEVIIKGIFKEGKTIGEWTKYYDGDWNLIFNKSTAKYFRKVKYDDSGKGVATDYYITGEKQWGGHVFGGSDIQDGLCTFYYKTGSKSSEGVMKAVEQYGAWKSSKSGEWKSWYESGKLKSVEEWDGQKGWDGKPMPKAGKYYDESGAITNVIRDHQILSKEEMQQEEANKQKSIFDNLYKDINTKYTQFQSLYVVKKESSMLVDANGKPVIKEDYPKGKHIYKKMNDIIQQDYAALNSETNIDKKISAATAIIRIIDKFISIAANDTSELDKQLKKIDSLDEAKKILGL